MLTAIAEQFAQRGIKVHEVRFTAALAQFLNNGGGIARAHSLIDESAEKMGSEAVRFSPRGRGESASPPQPNESAGPQRHADKALHRVPALSTERSGGHPENAHQAIIELPSAATERNGAGPAMIAAKAAIAMPRPVSPLYLAAARDGSKRLAITVLDSFKVRDGRAIGDLPWSGLDRIIGANTREAAVLRLVKDKIGGMPADPNATVRSLIHATDLERIIQKAAEVQDGQN